VDSGVKKQQQERERFKRPKGQLKNKQLELKITKRVGARAQAVLTFDKTSRLWSLMMGIVMKSIWIIGPLTSFLKKILSFFLSFDN
jgi:hypothetical protein